MSHVEQPPPPPPPPPPPSPPSATPIQKTIRIPPSAFPKADALMFLLQPASDGGLTADEYVRLGGTAVGDELSAVVSHCGPYRTKMQKSRAALKKSPKSRTGKQLFQSDLFAYQGCLNATACPVRVQHLMACWSQVPHDAANEFPCRTQREAVERCLGDLVARTVRTSSEDGNNDGD